LALHSSVSATSHAPGFPFCTAFVHQVRNELFNNLVAQFVGIAGLVIQGLVGFFLAVFYTFGLLFGAGLWLGLLGFVIIMIGTFLQ
jgi:hypothetical protein